MHAQPLLSGEAPVGFDDEVSTLLDRLRVLAGERPAGVLGALRRIERSVDDLLAEAVRNARQAGKSWSEIASPLRMSKQAAQQRFGRNEERVALSRR